MGTRGQEVSPWMGSQLVPPLWSPDGPRHLGPGAEASAELIQAGARLIPGCHDGGGGD